MLAACVGGSVCLSVSHNTGCTNTDRSALMRSTEALLLCGVVAVVCSFRQCFLLHSATVVVVLFVVAVLCCVVAVL